MGGPGGPDDLDRGRDGMMDRDRDDMRGRGGAVGEATGVPVTGMALPRPAILNFGVGVGTGAEGA